MSASAHARKRRNQFIEGISRSIIDIGRHQEDPTFAPDCIWIGEANTIFFRLRLDGCPLPLLHGDGLLQAFTFDDLIEQLDQIIIIAGFGGLDDALVACMDPRPE